MTNIALFSGSFDPVTYGHLDIIKRASKMFDTLIVGIGENSSKKYMFDTWTRFSFITKEIEFLQANSNSNEYKNIVVQIFPGLIVKFCKNENIKTIIRGVRNTIDFEQESTIARINQSQDPNIETIFLPTHPTLSHISSTVVKEIVKYGGNVSEYVCYDVEQALKQKLHQ
jgi:pantetheine-phosphate adenylyltransferase